MLRVGSTSSFGDNRRKEYGKEIKQIEEWTNCKNPKVIFDSQIDDWRKDKSIFDKQLLLSTKFYS